MKKVKIRDCRDQLMTHGRTFDTEEGMFCNWTCSGFSMGFRGSSLSVRIKAYPGIETDPEPMGEPAQREVWPYLAVFLDGSEEPHRYFEAGTEDQVYLLFQSETEESHTVTVRKMTENAKGKVCLMEFFTDGELEDPQLPKPKCRIEFIGDSITCGFGNMVKDEKRGFYSVDENGWMAHGAVAARKLGAEFSVISFSGITVMKGPDDGMTPPMMGSLYPYQDRLLEEMQGKDMDFTPWDFQRERPDVIVLNLGTNDITAIELGGDIPGGILRFEKDYYHFLEMLREKNGEEPWIICALGSLDYFLYDNIQKTVRRFSRDTGDERIRCYKYGRVRFNDGYGACHHPYVTTQVRMGEEIAEVIRPLLENK